MATSDGEETVVVNREADAVVVDADSVYELADVLLCRSCSRSVGRALEVGCIVEAVCDDALEFGPARFDSVVLGLELAV